MQATLLPWFEVGIALAALLLAIAAFLRELSDGTVLRLVLLGIVVIILAIVLSWLI